LSNATTSTARGAAGDPDGEGGRRGEAEGAGAGDDQDGDRRAQRGTERRRRPQYEPHDERRGGDDKDDRDEDRRDAVHEALDRRLRPLGLLDQANDRREYRVATDLRRAHAKRAGPVQRAAGHVVPGGLVHWDRLAGHHRFIDRRRARDHKAIRGDRLARPDDEHIAGLERCDVDVLLDAAAPADARGLRAERQEGADRISRACAGARLEEPADEDERDDRRRGLVVEVRVRLEPRREE
jgi:hypothetical protein